MKQSAVEWLQEQIKKVDYNPLEKNGFSIAEERLYEQAKKMEKQQQDEFACGFSEWLVDYYDEDESYREWDKSTEELLEIYKKEKGL